MTNRNSSFLDQCKKNLIDTTARNNLIHFKFTSKTSLDIDKLLQIQKNKKSQNQSFEIEKIDYSNTYQFNLELAKNSIINSAPDENKKLQQELHKTLEKIYLKQKEIKDEKGFNPTNWAYYFFKYPDGNNQKYAPIYLISTEVVKNKKGSYSVNHPNTKPLTINFNYAIYEKFKNDFQIIIDNKIIDFKDLSNASLDDIDQKISQIQEFLAENIKGISIEKKITLGIFNSAKASLYNELVDLEQNFLNHNLIKIFLSKDFNEFNQGEFQKPYEIDKISSDKFFSPFDFDSSQLQAIQAAKDGKNFIIQGPPGTGKTQTISNIIAELASCGKKVLFVAEKKAAIDAVIKNFSNIGLEKIFLDLHDKKSKSKEIIEQVIDSIDDFKNYSQNNTKDIFEKLNEAKKNISKRSDLLHQELSFNKKPFYLISELSQMEDVKKLDSDLFSESSKKDFDLCLNTLEQIAEFSDIYHDTNNIFLENNLEKLKNFLKNDADKKSITNFQKHIQSRNHLQLNILELSKILENLKKKFNEVNCDVEKFNKIEDLKNILQLFTKYLSHKENLYRVTQDPIKIFNIVKKVKNFFLKKKTNKSIKKTYLKIENHKLTETLQNIISNNNINQFNELVENYFRNKNELYSVKEELQKTIYNLKDLHQFISSYLKISYDFQETDLNNLEQEISLYAKYLHVLPRSISYLELKKNLEALSVISFWNQCLKNNILSSREIVKTFKKSFYSKVIESLASKNELISNTNLTSQIVDNFKILDKNIIQINKNRVIQSLKEKSSKSAQDSIFRNLKNRAKFPKPRQIISEYRDIIFNSIGCVVCSPLTICEYFAIDKKDIDKPIFDVVIFDEASQIFTCDALSSIFRAKQIIIAGDTQQMPPTNLFNNQDIIEDNDNDFEEEQNEEDINDYPGLLSYSATKLPEISLNWHYRSKFDVLIKPSNKFVYGERLITFPNSNRNEKPIEFHYLQEGIWEKQKNDYEAKYVITLLKEIYDTGARSVGVISINSKQQELIRSLISRDSALDTWLDSDDEDGLFVKNLENCQGDERDTIIICSSYAKNQQGKIDGRMFQQINSENSYKRLNVMFSRAKKKIHLLSSLKWQDIKNDDKKKGIDFFKQYLRFAETGNFGIPSKNHIKQDNFDSGFEESVCKSLRSLGYEIESQVGCSGYKIDLTVICPNTKNYILGIECDGEMYHSGKTARERDRLRQEVLESKGWNIHRIWSYDWIDSKNEELKKLQKKINQLIIQ